MRRVALTGTIGSGKSTVCGLISDCYDLPSVSTDQLSKEVIAPFQPGYYKLLKLLGQSYLRKDGSWNREKIAKIIFRDSGLLSEVESIIHPLVLNLMQKKIHKNQTEKKQALFLEIPLLFEKNLQNFVDTSILVAVEPYKQKENLQKRAGFNLSCITQRMKIQIPQEEKLKKADYIIWNKGSLKELKIQIKDLMQTMNLSFKKRKADA